MDSGQIGDRTQGPQLLFGVFFYGVQEKEQATKWPLGRFIF